MKPFNWLFFLISSLFVCIFQLEPIWWFTVISVGRRCWANSFVAHRRPHITLSCALHRKEFIWTVLLGQCNNYTFIGIFVVAKILCKINACGLLQHTPSYMPSLLIPMFVLLQPLITPWYPWSFLAPNLTFVFSESHFCPKFFCFVCHLAHKGSVTR